MRLSPQARTRLAVLLFFAGLLASGAVGYHDYGVGWDEPIQWLFGYNAYAHLLNNDPALLLASGTRYYGPVVEIMLIALEKALGLTDPRDIFLMRHAASFLLFCLGVFWLYRLATRRFGSRYWGLVAAAILAASPRIYGDAFGNTKDVPFMVFFIGAMLALQRLVEQPAWTRALQFGFASALAVATRIIGLFAVGLGGLVGLAALWRAPADQRRALFVVWALAMASSLAFTYALWPLLWTHPLDLFESIGHFSRFPWTNPVLYWGERIPANELPWHYIPVWVLVTTPLLYTVLAIVGVGATFARLRHKPADALEQSLPLLWLVVPWAIIVVRGAVLYDGWRHLFFVYPALVLLAVDGLRSLLTAPVRHATVVRGAIAGLAGLAWAGIAIKMVQIHPHQNVYFNALVPADKVSTEFDMDYWGLSYRDGLEAVLRSDPRPVIHFWVANTPGRYNGLILPAHDRDRMEFVEDSRQADYLITNFRYETAPYPLQEAYSRTVNGLKIMAVYRQNGH